jgi:hypothetical protein
MKRGWLLDYEIKKAFCSPLCNVTYRELKWEEAQRLTQVEMFPPELEVANNNNQPNFDWEKEGLRNELLFLREAVRELEQRLATNQPITPEERQQSNYLQRLQQNTLRSAENAYSDRYGNLSEDDPNKDKGGLSGGVIALLIIGGIGLIIGIIFLLTRKPRKNY